MTSAVASRRTLVPAVWLCLLLFPNLKAVRGEDRLDTADRLRLRGRYAEAIEIYALPQPIEADEIRAAWGQARCLEQSGLPAEAAATLESAVDRHPDAARLHAELARLAFERGDHDEAQRLADQALRLDKNRVLARWIAARLLTSRGRLKEALAADEWFVDFYNAARDLNDPEQLRWIGLAAAEYARWTRNHRQFHFLVNEFYPGLLELNENYWPAHVDAALLFLEKYNGGEAVRQINAALKINPNAADAHAAKAAWALQDFELEQARAALERALDINKNHLAAHQLKADALLAGFRPTEAVRTLEDARRLNPRDETTLGRLAAVYGVLDDTAGRPDGTRMGGLIDEVLSRNEHCGDFFLSLGEGLELMRRFPPAADYYREARERMPQLVAVRGRLGMLLMRLGQEDEAQRLLKASFEVDPFNVRVKNTLAVLEVLGGYETTETEHFLIRFDPQHDKLLVRYAAEFLENEVYPQICQRLGYEPPEKSLFEIFNRAKNTSGHGWFSARMVGLPYVGTVGACAGQMVAMASPNGLPQKFNWSRVLRHEFVHVVNLQQTRFNIPHWFTEALAVHFEGYPRPPEWDAVLARRFRAGELFDLGTIDGGFSRPADGDDWTLAYCQAELYADYMLERFGDDALARLLSAYGRYRGTEDAVDTAFSVTLEDFERGYSDYLAKIVAQIAPGREQAERSLAELQEVVRDHPDDADAAADLAYAYLKRRANPEARRYAETALRLRPYHQLASYVLARLYLSIGDARRAEAVLTACLDEKNRGDDPPQENALSLLAGLRLKAEDYAAAARWYGLGRQHYPHDVKWLKALAGVHLKADNTEKLQTALTELAPLDADDVTIRKKLAQLALEKEQYADAAKWANQAIRIDVEDAQVHAWLAEARVGLGQFGPAVQEYEVAIERQPTQLAWRLALADTHVQAGEDDKAGQVLRELLKIDPDFPGADVLLESLEP